MANIAEILTAQLDPISLRHLNLVAQVAESRGLQAYLVGGAIRDALLGLPVCDIDISVTGLTPQFAEEAARALNGDIAVRSQFNTFAVDASGRHIDLAMTRRETYSNSGALPTVFPGTIQQDLARRDFSINAMAVSINAASFGRLLDPFDGQSDLKTELVHVLHDASFRDDSTRILRAARYATRLGFTLETRTERILRRDSSYLDTISPARLRDEFERVLQESRAVSTLEMLYDLGVLRSINPALALGSQTSDALRRAEHSDYANKPSLYLSILTYSMTASERGRFVERLQLNARWRQTVLDTGLARSRIQDDPSVGAFSCGEIYWRLRALDEAAILGCSVYEEDSIAARRLTLYLRELRHTRQILSGSDLLALGVPQGPRIGELLHDLLEARLNREIDTRQDEINFIQARLSDGLTD